jgi:hypothetical protein
VGLGHQPAESELLDKERLVSWTGGGRVVGYGGGNQPAMLSHANYVTHTADVPNDSQRYSVLAQLNEGASGLEVMPGPESAIRGLADVTAMIAIWPSLYFPHIGDSRFYRQLAARSSSRPDRPGPDLWIQEAWRPGQEVRSPMPPSRQVTDHRADRPRSTSSPVMISWRTDGLIQHVSDQQITNGCGA